MIAFIENHSFWYKKIPYEPIVVNLYVQVWLGSFFHNEIQCTPVFLAHVTSCIHTLKGILTDRKWFVLNARTHKRKSLLPEDVSKLVGWTLTIIRNGTDFKWKKCEYCMKCSVIHRTIIYVYLHISMEANHIFGTWSRFP